MIFMVRSEHALLPTCWFAWFWNFSYRMMVPALLPAIQASLLLSNWQAGNVIGVLNLGYAASAYPSGLYSTRFGPKRIICFGIVLTAVCMLLLTISQSYLTMLALTFIAGLGLGTYLPQGLALLSQEYGKRKRGTIMGVHETAAPIGQAIGPLFVSMMLLPLGWTGCIQAWFALAAIPVISFLFVVSKYRANPSSGENIHEVREWPLRLYATVVLLNSCIWSANLGLISMIPIYMVQVFLLDAAFAAFLVGATRFSGAFGQLMGGALSDRVGRFKVLLAVVAVTAVSTVGVAFAPFGPVMIASMVIQAMATAAFFPVIFATVSDHTSSRTRAKVLGIINAAAGFIGGSLSPIIIGYLADEFNFKDAFLYPVILGFFACFLILYLRKQLS